MAYSRAVSSWFEARRGLALAVMMCGGAVGAIVLPPLAQALIAGVGWRRACLLLGAGAIAVGLPTVLRLVRERPATRPAAGGTTSGAPVGAGLRSAVFWILVAVLFVASIGQNGALAHLSALLTDRGIPASGGALALSAMGGAGLVGRLLTGWFLDRCFGGYVSFVLLALAAFGVFLLAGAQSLAAGVVAATLIGFGMGGEADVIPYMLSRYFGLRSFAQLYGFTWTAYACAGALGPILMGRAFDLTGSYETLLVGLSGGMLAVASLMLVVPRYPAIRAVPSA
jgi:predicted MFS family arabinose efflux permease